MKKIFLMVLHFSRQIHFTYEYQYENRSKNIQPVAPRCAEQDIPFYSCKKLISHYFNTTLNDTKSKTLFRNLMSENCFNIKIHSLLHSFWLSAIRAPPLLFR
ncbi:hypothetical protein EG346_19810 [Chryseobacterium carnipullorum]|uniref:Uncharacterized protein n=1 Tax=Chryseobacterium carnipullorum TaxID=1124835 RepID=A0A376DYM6_CHRCU|nr:hypothetical protein EG346_19810 [Chryseobacterium carnipullorum]AZA65155.1 hypothetical protein EG345_10855 [Chryseobacterium carnipullorum]STC98249.1 Uncharacterised protein [Chryseobacterium carnipullorum]